MRTEKLLIKNFHLDVDQYTKFLSILYEKKLSNQGNNNHKKGEAEMF